MPKETYEQCRFIYFVQFFNLIAGGIDQTPEVELLEKKHPLS